MHLGKRSHDVRNTTAPLLPRPRQEYAAKLQTLSPTRSAPQNQRSRRATRSASLHTRTTFQIRKVTVPDKPYQATCGLKLRTE